MTNEQARVNGWKTLVPADFKVIAKAIFSDEVEEIMKTTKRLAVEGGWIYTVTTEIRGKGAGAGVVLAEAMCFVPKE